MTVSRQKGRGTCSSRDYYKKKKLHRALVRPLRFLLSKGSGKDLLLDDVSKLTVLRVCRRRKDKRSPPSFSVIHGALGTNLDVGRINHEEKQCENQVRGI